MLWFPRMGILLSNLLITNIGFRYIYRFMPMFLLVVAYAAAVLASELARIASPTGPSSVRSPARGDFCDGAARWRRAHVVSVGASLRLVDTNSSATLQGHSSSCGAIPFLAM